MSESAKTVLIVDDEAFIRQSLADYFEDNLWKTLQAESGEQALELLERGSPAGAIVDIRLPGMDGNCFIREAAKKKTYMAFLVCTGSPEYDVPVDLQKLPCVSNRLFRKPVTDMTELEKELICLIESLNEKKVHDESPHQTDEHPGAEGRANVT